MIRKKSLWFALMASVLLGCSGAQKESSYLKRVWVSSAQNLSTPESVVYDAHSGMIYVSNVNAVTSKNPWQDNGGFISLLNAKGEVKKLHWVDGLKAPKGLTIGGEYLYVADLNGIVKIDPSEAKILKRYQAPKGVERLNDIVYDENRSMIYVSDSGTKALYALSEKDGVFHELYPKEKGDKAEENGLYLDQSGVVMQGSVGYLKMLDLKTHKVKILSSEVDIAIDGVTKYLSKGYLVSTWIGEIHHVDTQGKSKKLLDSKPEHTADICYVSELDLLLVPDFDKHIIAYKVKKIN